MMHSSWGDRLQITIFGQSHARVVGVTIQGLPAGARVELDQLQAFLNRRAPGRGATATPRREGDKVEILCGLVDGVTCGAPLTAVIANTDTRPEDYAPLRDMPRPGHADYTAQIKYGGQQDARGGGQFSGRMTAPLCIAGGICRQLLAGRGVSIHAHMLSVETAADRPFDPMGEKGLEGLESMALPVLRPEAAGEMEARILQARMKGDSVGGVAECMVQGHPAGLGGPLFGGLESRLAALLFGIPAVKGVEFGAGFESARMRGSQHNDPFVIAEGKVKTQTNHHGGILGGISTGMPLVFRLAVKPTPSIPAAQQTISLAEGTPRTLELQGRHDPCILPRVIPVVEAAAALAVMDAWLEEYGWEEEQ